MLGWDVRWEDGEFFLERPVCKVYWIGTSVDSNYGVACDGCLEVRKGGLERDKWIRAVRA